MKRRTFLIRGSTFLAIGATLPRILERAVFAGTLDNVSAATGSKTLVVVQLAGGVDGLNVVIPHDNPTYKTLRSNLAGILDTAVPIDNQYALHPALAPLQPIWEAGRLGIVHGVSYPNSDLSHFKAMAVWHTSNPAGTPADGWLGKYLNVATATAPNPFTGLANGRDVPPSLRSATTPAVVVESVSAYKLNSSSAA